MQCMIEKEYSSHPPIPILEKDQQGEISDFCGKEEEGRRGSKSNNFEIPKSALLFDRPKHNFTPLPHLFFLIRVIIVLLLIPFLT